MQATPTGIAMIRMLLSSLRAAVVVLPACLVLACSDGRPTAPVREADDALDNAITSSERVVASGRAAPFLGMIRFPDSLALTPEQEARIRQLVDAHVNAHAADLAALDAILRELIAARRAGQSNAELRNILERARPIRERLAAAQRELQSAIWAVLTPAQRAYLESRRDNLPCRVTPEQARQLKQLHEHFQHEHAADLALERQLLARVVAAIQGGASRDEILALLDSARDVRDRLAAARAKLAEQVRAVVGNSGCELLPPPPPGLPRQLAAAG